MHLNMLYSAIYVVIVNATEVDYWKLVEMFAIYWKLCTTAIQIKGTAYIV